jgi:hypothetical protein
MRDEPLDQLDAVLREIGYQTTQPAGRPGVLGESPTRVVWATEWPGVISLIEGWEDEQTWLVEYAAERISTEKSWELYLVLACGPAPDENERQALEGIRRDLGYARKLVVPGFGRMTPARVLDYLAPLEDLTLEVPQRAPEALELLRERAAADSRTDVLAILEAHRRNEPLLEALNAH